MATARSPWSLKMPAKLRKMEYFNFAAVADVPTPSCNNKIQYLILLVQQQSLLHLGRQIAANADREL